MQLRPQRLGVVLLLGAAPTGHDGPGGGDAGDAREAEELPGDAHAPTLPRVPDSLTLDEAVATATTGDVWLFRGRSWADVAIRTLTNSPVNHVGMVVALDDLPPLLWHAELGRSLPDVWTGRLQRGVQLHRLRDAVTTWEKRYGQRAWTRQLEGPLERRHEDRLVETIERYDGRAFPTTLGLAGRWARGRYRRRESSLESIYCAELVAATFQAMGVLPAERPASWYDPGRFWSGDHVALVPPFRLAAEVPVHSVF
ncbi:MAG: hypothetical protein JWO90_338 [Solirubrobacterales bacterium]|nr:hypothetical protein [Solirubrobacterales bacterium]